MITLTTLDILYIVLSLFTVIVWTLLTIILFKVIKILNPVLEIVDYYNQFKSYLASYKVIPAVIKEKVFEIIWSFWKKTNDDFEEEVVEKKKKSKKNKVV